MIRVLNILDTIGSGGVERRRLSMAKLLDKTKYDLKIICTNTKGGIADEIRNYGVEVIEIGDLKSFLDFKQHQKVIAIINQFKPHIIHGAVFEGVTMAAMNGFFKRVPIIIIEETSDPQNRRWKGDLLMKFFATLSDQLIGVSPAATAYLTDKLKINKNKVQLVLNGIATPRTVGADEIQQLKNELNIQPDTIVIGSMGRMKDDNHKRFSDLINAFSLLLKEMSNCKLILVGEGPEKAKYIDQVNALGINDNVIFTGYQGDVPLYYSIFDVFSLVSGYEAFGLVLAEAMLQQLPIVATKVGGMQYIVDDGKTGFLVEKFDVEAIKNKLMVLCSDPNLRQKMGQAGYEKAVKNYTEQNYINQLEALYDRLVAKKKLV